MRISSSLIVGFTRYSKVWNKFFKPLNPFNCGIAGDRVQHVIWRAIDLRHFSSLRNVNILYGTTNLYQDSPEGNSNRVVKIAICFIQGNNVINMLICTHKSPAYLLIKEAGNILKSSSFVSHINFIDQDANRIQRSGFLKPDIFYSGKLHLVEKGKFFRAKSIYISMNSHYGLRKKYQLSKKYKSMTAFSLNKADFPTLTPLSPRKPVADCISVSLYKSVHNSFITCVQKPYISSIKTVLRKCSIYDSSLGDTNKCVHVSVNHTICKAFVTHFRECAVNNYREVFKVFFIKSFCQCSF